MKNSIPTPIRADLHFHSTLSDGRKTPEEIVAIAEKQGIWLLVNTDHDLINTETTKLARDAGITSFEGVEISAYEPVSDKHLHITCYAEKFSDRIHNVMSDTRTGRRKKIKHQIGQLQWNGFKIDAESFFRYFGNQWVNTDNLSNSHLAEYIYQNPENTVHMEQLTWENLDYGAFIRKCLKKEGEYSWIGGTDVPKYEPSIELCGELARENKALLSIAHSNFTFSRDMDRIDTIILPYIEAGVEGIEINTEASPEWVDTILRTKKRYGLVLTFGSDCHFKNPWDGKHNELGTRNPCLDDTQFKEMVETFIDTVAV